MIQYDDDATRVDALALRESDTRWATRFAAATTALGPALRSLLVRPIEHIGSTAVPGLPAKPIVDMLAVVTDVAAVERRSAALAEIGWLPSHPDGTDPLRLGWCTPDPASRTHHLHVVAVADPGWPDWLRFRDALRDDPDLRDAYARCKRAAVRGATSRQAYREAKAPFIRSVLAGGASAVNDTASSTATDPGSTTSR